MAWVLCLLLQDDVVQVRRAEKGPYDSALRKYKEAEIRLSKDPKGAIAFVEEIFQLELKHVECRLKIERDVGEWSDPIEFYPHQLRARARLALAASDKDNAEKHLQDAIQDLETSVKAKIQSSEPLLKEAKEKLEKRKPVDDRGKTFETAWTKLIQERKYRSALRHLEEKGAFLDVSARQKHADQAEDACRAFVADALEPFGNRVRLNALADLAAQFPLPDESELVGSHPLLEWSKAQRAAFERILAKQDATEPLLAQILAARSLGARWFRVAADLANEYLEARTAALPKGTAGERRAARAEAGRLLKLWSGTVEGLEPEWRDQLPRSQLAILLASIPVDPEDLDSIDIDACFHSDRPEEAFGAVIEKLEGILRTDGLSASAKRQALTYLVAASAIRALLAGRTVEQVLEDLRIVRGDLKRAGGAIDPDRWGPKVERVLRTD